MNNIEVYARKNAIGTCVGWVGGVTIWAGDRRMYSKSTGIVRLTQEDAFEDAKNLKSEMQEGN